jgi:putative ABC transport system substrate-binding protein
VAAWPLAVQAQKLAQTRRVSVLLGLTENDPLQNARLRAFRLGMRDLEWIEGRNIQIEYLFAGANLALINQQVAELIRSAPDAIVAKSTPVLAALRTATSTTPLDRLDRALHRFSSGSVSELLEGLASSPRRTTLSR